MTDLERGLARLPAHMRNAARDYVMDGKIPGDFLQAVICDKFVEAFNRADSINEAYMRAWAQFAYMEMPAASRGSKEDMEGWAELGGINGLERKRLADLAAKAAEAPNVVSVKRAPSGWGVYVDGKLREGGFFVRDRAEDAACALKAELKGPA